MMDNLIVKDAFCLTGDKKAILFSGWNHYKFGAGDVLMNTDVEFSIKGITPNIKSNTLTVWVECEDFKPDELVGVELTIKHTDVSKSA
ncbi:MAG: hypothetical protein FWH55_06880 [Oscillospiraceae bacterium]|nr:hypothetical protein [Oscillospiraceae bacterium]